MRRACLMACAQVGGKIGCWIHQLTQVNDSLDVCIPRGFGKIAGNFQIAVGTDLPSLLSVDEVIGSRNILHGIHQWPLGESIPGYHFHPLQPGTTLQAARVPHQTAYTVTRVE